MSPTPRWRADYKLVKHRQPAPVSHSSAELREPSLLYGESGSADRAPDEWVHKFADSQQIWVHGERGTLTLTHWPPRKGAGEGCWSGSLLACCAGGPYPAPERRHRGLRCLGCLS